MYERFTDRARKVMQLARSAAQEYGHEYIGTEHILIGLVAEGRGLGAHVLLDLGLGKSRLKLELEKIIVRGATSITGEAVGGYPLTPRAKRAIDFASEEAAKLKDGYIGTEHILLGLLRETEGVAGQLIELCGIARETVRDRVLALHGAHPQASSSAVPLASTLQANPHLAQTDVFALVRAERAYQDHKWGTLTEHPHEVGAWLLVLQGKLEQAVKEWQTTAGSDVPSLSRLAQVAAVAFACLEQHGGNLLVRMLAEMEFAKTHCGYMSPSARSQSYWPVLEVIRQRMAEVAKEMKS